MSTSSKSNVKYMLFFAVTILFVVLDQVSKIWVIRNIKGPRMVVKDVNLLDKFGVTLEEWAEFPSSIDVIPGFFSLVHTQNTGAAFGIMEGQMIVFAIFTTIAFGTIFFTLAQMPDEDHFQNWALALLTSGVIGNAIDRIHKQSVTDFLHVYFEPDSTLGSALQNVIGSTAWPSFNIADAAIVVGMIMFGIFYVFLEQDHEDDGEDIKSPEHATEGL
jgi:signal peptidase II